VTLCFSDELLKIESAGMAPAPPVSEDYSTSFPATENPISEGGLWVNGLATGLLWNDMKTANGNVIATVTNPSGFADNCAHLIGFAPDQYIEGVVHREAGYNPADVHEIELLLHAQFTANNCRGYELLTDTAGNSAIVRWNGPTNDFTVLSATGSGIGAIAHGDVIRFQVIGSAIKAYKNTVLALEVTDTVFTDGNPGVGSFMRGSGNVLANLGWQSIVAGNL